MTKRKTPRGLDPDERELWERVARTTTPMKSRPTAPAPKFEEQGSKTDNQQTSKAPPLAPFKIGSSTDVHRIAVQRPSGKPTLKMDQKAFTRLKRGKLKPERKLDLHGMTLAQARPALTEFVLSAQAQGKRLVLVITGKGRDRDEVGPIPVRTGLLRSHVPDWLARPPLAMAVLQVVEAHQRHGGSGAFYVYLKRL